MIKLETVDRFILDRLDLDTSASTLQSSDEEHEDAAAILVDEVHPVLRRPPEQGHRLLCRQKQHLHRQRDEHRPPPPPVGDLGAGGAVDGRVLRHLARPHEVGEVV